MDEVVLVVAENMVVFRHWCRDHDVDFRDKKFRFVNSYWDVYGWGVHHEYTLHLLVLHGGLARIEASEYWYDQNGRHESISPLQNALEISFHKPWDVIKAEAKAYELTY